MPPTTRSTRSTAPSTPNKQRTQAPSAPTPTKAQLCGALKRELADMNTITSATGRYMHSQSDRVDLMDIYISAMNSYRLNDVDPPFEDHIKQLYGGKCERLLMIHGLSEGKLQAAYENAYKAHKKVSLTRYSSSVNNVYAENIMTWKADCGLPEMKELTNFNIFGALNFGCVRDAGNNEYNNFLTNIFYENYMSHITRGGEEKISEDDFHQFTKFFQYMDMLVRFRIGSFSIFPYAKEISEHIYIAKLKKNKKNEKNENTKQIFTLHHTDGYANAMEEARNSKTKAFNEMVSQIAIPGPCGLDETKEKQKPPKVSTPARGKKEEAAITTRSQVEGIRIRVMHDGMCCIIIYFSNTNNSKLFLESSSEFANKFIQNETLTEQMIEDANLGPSNNYLLRLFRADATTRWSEQCVREFNFK